MACLSVSPWVPPRAGIVPGDRTGLSRPPRDPARGHPLGVPRRRARAVHTRKTLAGIFSSGLWAWAAPVAGFVTPPAPPFNPHTGAPAPRFCPYDF
jgi:hypothetical protein